MCETRTPIDARVIALDETEYFNILPRDFPFVRTIHGVYLFDANEHTHLCELTASHYLIFLYYSVQLTDAGMVLTEGEIERILDHYEMEVGDNRYIHCADLKRLTKTTSNYLEYGATEIAYDDSDYAEQMEELRENFCGTPPF